MFRIQSRRSSAPMISPWDPSEQTPSGRRARPSPSATQRAGASKPPAEAGGPRSARGFRGLLASARSWVSRNVIYLWLHPQPKPRREPKRLLCSSIGDERLSSLELARQHLHQIRSKLLQDLHRRLRAARVVRDECVDAVIGK